MRFAYIDSQGNEVEIPSEDALRLRIELGAIVEGTSFFDGSSGRWAPAGEHEVFRRLKRDLAEKDHPGPLPVGQLRPDAEPPPPTRPSRPIPPPAATEPEPPAPPPAPTGPTPPTPADPPPEVDPGRPIPTSHEDSDEGFDFGDFGALDLEEAGPVPARSSSPSPESPTPKYGLPDDPPDEPEGDPWTVPGRDPWAPELDDPSDSAPRVESASFGDEPAPPAEPAPGDRHPFDADEEMPDWLRNDPEFGEDAPKSRPFPTRDQVRERYEMDHGAPPPPPAGVRRPPVRSTRASGGGSWGRIAAVVAAVVVVGGGAAWFLTRGDDASGVRGGERVVELPPIAPSLEPVFRQAAAAAFVATVDSLRTLPARAAVPDEPHADWLAGRYMATAGDYADVRLYWEALGRYEQVMRAREADVFAAALDVALDSVTLAPDDRAVVVDRSMAGFEAAGVERDAVYQQLRAVVDAALSLHLFLEQNQAAIDYDPADAGLSRDPVLEAVPDTDDLGEEMWNRVAEITSALDQLGFLDRVTTERLLEVFFDKLAAAEVR